MFTSSELVSATRMSVSAMPAASSVAGDGAHVDAPLQVAQQFLVGVGDGDLVGRLPCQLVGRAAADLPGTEYQNLQGAALT
jgi:hypothetical protein